MRLPVPEGERHCRVCGCWEGDRCKQIIGATLTCKWIAEDLCSSVSKRL